MPGDLQRLRSGFATIASAAFDASNAAGDGMRALLKALARAAAWPLALIVIFEEWGWAPLQRAMAWLAQKLHLRWFEARIQRLPPYPALALFLLPSLLLLPVKLAALWLVGQGHVVWGVVVVALAKLTGTAIVARLFVLTQPALMQLNWFAVAYRRWTSWKHVWLAHIRASWPWRWGRVVRRQAVRLWQRLTRGSGDKR